MRSSKFNEVRLEELIDGFRLSEGLDIFEFRDFFVVVFFLSFLKASDEWRGSEAGICASDFFKNLGDGFVGLSGSIGAAVREAEEVLGGGYSIEGVVDGFLSRMGGSSLLSVRDLCTGIDDVVSQCESLSEVGGCFEHVVRLFSEGSGKRAGEAYTPRGLVDLMVGLVRPGEGEKIYDPTCGSGGFLVACHNFVSRSRPDASVELYGREINLSSARVAKINGFVHGNYATQIILGNSIFDSEVGKYDVVLANPPFSVSGWNVLGERCSSCFRYGVPPKSNADYAFIQAIIGSLNNGGRAAVVVSNGVLFRGGVEGEIRRKIIDDGLVEAVISLPAGMLLGTMIPTAILVFNRKNKSRGVFFLDSAAAYEHFFKEGKRMESVESAALFTFNNFMEIGGVSRVVELSEIEGEGFSLSVSRYVSAVGEERVSLEGLIDRQLNLDAELQRLQVEFYSMLPVGDRKTPN